MRSPAAREIMAVHDLPGPRDGDGRAVVIFDGHCRFCRRQVARLHRADRDGRLAFLSLDDPEAGRRFPQLERDRLQQALHLVGDDGSVLAGADAVQQLVRILPRWRCAVPILHIPGSLIVWRLAYALVARWRYRFGGRVCRDGTCQLPTRADSA